MNIRNTVLSLVLFCALAVGAVLIAGSFGVGVANADTPASSPASSTASGVAQIDEAGEAEDADENEAEDEGDQTALAKGAKVSRAQAIAAASAKVSGKVVEVEIEKEGGVVLYSIEFDSGNEAEVDATTGVVLGIESDD